jgi:hypothetical protein
MRHHNKKLAGVEATEKILVMIKIEALLSTLAIRSPAQQLGARATQKNTHNRVTQIVSSLGK